MPAADDVAHRDERQARAWFEERYAMPRGEVLRGMEMRVIGATWGANGYTTLAQADELANRLALSPDSRLLDVGTGRGWPGLYLAQRSGCSLVATDMPVGALAAGARRARREGIDDRVSFVAAAGAAQPLRPHSFDALVHTDVLC